VIKTLGYDKMQVTVTLAVFSCTNDSKGKLKWSTLYNSSSSCCICFQGATKWRYQQQHPLASAKLHWSSISH